MPAPRPYVRITRFADGGCKTLSVLALYPKGKAAWLDGSYREPSFVAPYLEPPWRGNQKKVSCIPAGSYTGEHRVSPKFGRVIWIRGCEPERELVLTHAGNSETDTEGCGLPGMGFADVNGDGDVDVVESRKALAAYLALIPNVDGQDVDIDVIDATRLMPPSRA